MRISRLAAPLALLAALIAAPAALHAQDPAFRGTYARDVAAGDDMEAVINDALPKVKSTLGRIFRGKARERLREVNRPYGWIRFTPGDAVLTMETDLWNGEWKLTAPRNGRLEKWRRRAPDGSVEVVDVVSNLQGSTLTHQFQGEDGNRINVYSLSPDGRTLTMNVTVTSDKLTGPVTYRLVYRRRE